MMSDFRRDSVLMAITDHASCELGGEAVVLNLNSGVYYGLDAVGTLVWRLIQRPRSLAELRDQITEEFDVTAERCEADLVAFATSLRALGLLSCRDAA